MLRPYQTEAVEAVLRQLQQHRSTLLVAATGCHVAGQRLLMFDGSTKLVEDVVVGDRLMGVDSRPRAVLALARGEDEIVEIRPTKGRPWKVNRGHILTLIKTAQDGRRRGGEIVDVGIEEWRAWGKTKKHVHKLLRAPVDHFDCGAEHCAFKLEPYHLGLLLGDGEIGRYRASVATVDQEIADAVYDMARCFGAGVRVDGLDRCPVYHVHSKWKRNGSLLRHLGQLGLVNLVSASKFVPHAYKTSTTQARLDLLAGLVDTDGHLSFNGYDYISASERLAEDVVFLARSVGLAAYLSPCKKSSQHGTVGDYFRVSISGDVDRIPCRLPRKKAAPRAQKKSVLRTGFEIVDCGYRAPFFGFTLDGDGRYLLDDFTVTHNTGKTIMFSAIAERMRPHGRVLVLAHREELLAQARDKISASTKLRCGIEQGDRRVVPEQGSMGFGDGRSSYGLPDVVIASVPTLARERRRAAFAPNAFSIVIVDEAHHTTAASYRAILDHFPAARVLGVTATPDRADGVPLSTIFRSTAFRYGVRRAIADGYLVDVRQRLERIPGLDLASVRVTAGDLNALDLERLLAQDGPVAAVARRVVALAGDRPTILFGATVKHAQMLATAIGRLTTPGAARAIDGSTDTVTRARTIADYQAGTFQFLSNCAVLTEGFDAPATACIATVRPTKSRALYTQIVGRGTRLAPGKSDLLVIAFTGETGRHDLATPVDVVGAESIPAARERAAELLSRRPDLTITAALAEVERRTIAGPTVVTRPRRAAPIVDHLAVARELRGIVLPAPTAGAAPSTEAQAAALREHGIEAPALDARQASMLLEGLRWRRVRGLTTVRQAALLQHYGHRPDRAAREAAAILAPLVGGAR